MSESQDRRVRALRLLVAAALAIVGVRRLNEWEREALHEWERAR